MSELKVIYLGPACQEQGKSSGREWCQDDVWDTCECGHESVRYVLGAEFDRVTAERDVLLVREAGVTEELERQKRYVEINANSAQGKHAEGQRYRDERDALQLRLNAADQRIDELTESKTDRSPQDYAVEHAEYMAKSADHVLVKFQAYGLALLAVDEGGDDGEGELLESIDSTRQDLQESLVDLRGMVYEFRKRSNRCTPQ